MASRKMNVDALKLDFLKEFLQIQDLGVVQKFLAMLKETKSSPQNGTSFVGYHPDGRSITLDEIMADIVEGQAEYKRGECMSIEDFEKETESW